MYTREQFALKLNANGDPKLNAAADFAARLLNGPLGDRVAKIMLFGSVARGEARPDSDIDVMVFARAPRHLLSEATAHAASEATIEFGELVSPLTYPLSRLLYQRPYVVYTTLKRGQEIYAMNEKTQRQHEAQGLLRKAERLWAQAKDNLERQQPEAAIVLGYTAAENAAKALIALKPNVDLPGTHGGTLQMLAREYVRTGEVPAHWSSEMHHDLELRSRALYDYDVDPTYAEAQHIVNFAMEVINFLRDKLDEESIP